MRSHELWWRKSLSADGSWRYALILLSRDCRSKEPPRRLTWLRTMVLKLDAGFDDGTLLSVISKSGRDRAICPSQPDYGSSPDGFPRAADRIIAISRSEAGTAQRI